MHLRAFRNSYIQLKKFKIDFNACTLDVVLKLIWLFSLRYLRSLQRDYEDYSLLSVMIMYRVYRHFGETYTSMSRSK